MSAAIPVKSWYLAEHDIKEKRLPHRREDSDPVDLEKACEETGLQIFQVSKLVDYIFKSLVSFLTFKIVHENYQVDFY